MKKEVYIQTMVLLLMLVICVFASAFISITKSKRRKFNPSDFIINVSDPIPKRCISSNIIMVWKEKNGRVGWCNVSDEQIKLVQLGVLTSEDLKIYPKYVIGSENDAEELVYKK